MCVVNLVFLIYVGLDLQVERSEIPIYRDCLATCVILTQIPRSEDSRLRRRAQRNRKSDNRVTLQRL